MKNLARFFGGLGVIFVVFGIIASLMFVGQLRAIGYVQLLLGVVGIGIFLFYFLGEAMRTVSQKREAIFGVIGALLVLFILIGANVVARSKFGERKVDTTVNKIHSLSAESASLVKTLPTKVEVLGFFKEGMREREALKDVVEKYTYVTDKVEFKLYDPDKDKGLLKQYDANAGEVLVRNVETKKSTKLTGIGEQEITMGIKRVMSKDSKVVYFLQGHGEGDLEDDKSESGLFAAKFLLENEGLKVLPLNLANKMEIPKDAAMIAAWGAQRPYSKGEADLLLSYLERGGQLVIGYDPLIAPTRDKVVSSGLEPILEKYGIQIQSALVLELQVHLLQGRVINPQIAIFDYNKSHPIVRTFGPETVTEFSLASPVQQVANYKGDAKREVILMSSDRSWGETDVGSFLISRKPANSQKNRGPLPLGQTAEWPTAHAKDKITDKGRLVVFGDADFGTSGAIQRGFNRDLFLNSFNWLTGEESTISIRPKTWTTSTLEITPDQRNLVTYASLFILPEFIMALGMVIWILRRSRV